MTVREIIEDHSLAGRLSLRQAGGDEYWGFCPWCRMAGALMLNPRNNTARCTNKKCALHGHTMTVKELDARPRS